MNTEEKRKAFIEIAERLSASALYQNNYNDETFFKTFNCTRDEALVDSIKYFRHELFDIDE